MILAIAMLPLFCGFVLAVYWNSRHGEFLFDDRSITSNTWVKHAQPHLSGERYAVKGFKGWWGYWRAQGRVILFWTYHRDMAKHGPNSTVGWHDTNIAIHAVNSSLVYTILLAYYSLEAAILGTLVWISYPLATSAVASIAGRSSSLCAMFYLGGMVAWLLGAWPVTVVCLYLGWKVKEEIAMLPVACAVLWWVG